MSGEECYMNNKDKSKRRKSFFKSLRDYSKNRKAKRNFSDRYSEICSDGSIRIRVDGKNELFSPYSFKNDLSPELIGYIEDTAYNIPIDRPLNICFSSVEKDDQEKVIKAYKKYFELSFNDKCLDLRIYFIKSVILMIFGFIFLSVGIIFSHFDAFWGLNEIFTVAASFSMWESIDFFLLGRTEIKTKKLDTAQLLLAKIEFIE